MQSQHVYLCVCVFVCGSGFLPQHEEWGEGLGALGVIVMCSPEEPWSVAPSLSLHAYELCFRQNWGKRRRLVFRFSWATLATVPSPVLAAILVITFSPYAGTPPFAAPPKFKWMNSFCLPCLMEWELLPSLFFQARTLRTRQEVRSVPLTLCLSTCRVCLPPCPSHMRCPPSKTGSFLCWDFRRRAPLPEANPRNLPFSFPKQHSQG